MAEYAAAGKRVQEKCKQWNSVLARAGCEIWVGYGITVHYPTSKEREKRTSERALEAFLHAYYSLQFVICIPCNLSIQFTTVLKRNLHVIYKELICRIRKKALIPYIFEKYNCLSDICFSNITRKIRNIKNKSMITKYLEKLTILSNHSIVFLKRLLN